MLCIEDTLKGRSVYFVPRYFGLIDKVLIYVDTADVAVGNKLGKAIARGTRRSRCVLPLNLSRDCIEYTCKFGKLLAQ